MPSILMRDFTVRTVFLACVYKRFRKGAISVYRYTTVECHSITHSQFREQGTQPFVYIWNNIQSIFFQLVIFSPTGEKVRVLIAKWNIN